MPSTPIKQRTRISISYKVKLIEDSKKPGFSRKIAEQKYGIGRNTISTVLLKKQNEILKNFDSGLISKNAESSWKSPLAEVEAKFLNFWLKKLECVYQLMGHCWLNEQKLFMREWTEWTENLKIHFKWFDTPYVFLKLLSI